MLRNLPQHPLLFPFRLLELFPEHESISVRLVRKAAVARGRLVLQFVGLVWLFGAVLHTGIG